MSGAGVLNWLFGRVLASRRPRSLYLTVDLPEPGTVSTGALEIRGWTFSRRGRVVEVQAGLAGDTPIVLKHGAPRPDVARAYDHPDAERSGFEGHLVVGRERRRPSDTAGVLIVRATYDSGETAKVKVPIRVTAAVDRPVECEPVRPRATHVPPVWVRRIGDIVEAFRGRYGRGPTILDWQSAAPIAEIVPQLAVFSPPTPERFSLPYHDRTVDLVVVNRGAREQVLEAHRVAVAAVVEVGGLDTDPKVDWIQAISAESAVPLRAWPATSIVIPVHDGAALTDRCLARVVETLPAGLEAEILVVDDASEDETSVLARWAGAYPFVRVLRNETNLGFLQTCNRGARDARGEILVFLNNDTEPQAGWLPPLLERLRLDPTAGAVGGKLLYPDGTLQEAGGVIFADGSGCNFGRRDPNPGAPLYSFAREVDYCSGALLAVRREVFLELGGFDTRFSPAYYEDTDLCFQLRAAGYRVWFEPASVVVHVEGASSGTDVASGVKRFQAVNRDKFVEKWAAVLATQPAPPATYDTNVLTALSVRDARPRALVCAPRLPEFDRESGSRRVLHHIESLQEAGWAVSAVAFDPKPEPRYVRELQGRGVATYTGVDAGEVDRLLAAGRFDLALLVFWDAAERVLPRVRALSPHTRVIVDSVDLHFVRMARGAFHRSAGHEPEILDILDSDRIGRELNMYAFADAVLTVSSKEAALVNDLTADPRRAWAVPLGEDLPRSPFRFAERRGLLFIGNFRHPPNLEGLTFLCREVLPRLDPGLRSDHPLSVVGNNLDDRVLAVLEGVASVRPIGWVPSLEPYLDRARVSVIPLLHGAGTKLKLIQALMIGTPSVSTPVGIEGLELEADRHVLVAESPEDFAAKIAVLLTDAARWHRLADEGRAWITETHSRGAARARLGAVVEDVMSRPARPSRAIHSALEFERGRT